MQGLLRSTARFWKIGSEKQLCHQVNYRFVPECDSASENDINSLRFFLISRPRTLVLTGAGVSTESGIPDYRSDKVGLYARANFRPVLYSEFVQNENVQKRYWARNFIAWDRFSAFQPNVTHYALAKLQAKQQIQEIITQNVDCLHLKAGSTSVTELHGNGYTVKCIKCKYKTSRHEFQDTLKVVNSSYHQAVGALRPDGDIEISEKYIYGFKVPKCPLCGNHLKPNIVFFGENIPKNVIQKSFELIRSCDALLVLGSSLQVFSGYRLVLQAKERGIPIVIVNIGATRNDKLAYLKILAPCGTIIPKLL